MNGEKYIKQAVIAALCDHPEAEKYRQRAFSGDSLEKMALMQQSQRLTKNDFLTATDDAGKLMIDNPGIWKNFEKIVKIVSVGGDAFGYDDFMKNVSKDGERTLLESAWRNGGLSSVFTFDVWKGRFDEMEHLWYKVPKPNRDMVFGNNGLIPADLKRQIFAAEGKITPEDRLSRLGMSFHNIRQAFASEKDFEEASARLRQAGDYFRKEYILMTDSSGDTVFDIRPEPWKHYEAAVKIMKEHGERFEIADYTRQVSRTKNILSRAAEHGVLHKVFSPAHWEGRLPEMLNLWSQVLPAWKTGTMTPRDFDSVYAAAESATYMKHFQARPVMGKADLLKPLNEVSESKKPVLPLGLKAVWDRVDTIRAALRESGERLTLSDLRQASGEMGNSCLINAVKYGYFDKVVAVAQESGETISMDDFLTKDFHGTTLVSILAEKNQLSSAFSADLWAGRVAEMKALWLHVSVAQRSQVDIVQAEVNARQELLKRKSGGGFVLKRSRPEKKEL